MSANRNTIGSERPRPVSRSAAKIDQLAGVVLKCDCGCTWGRVVDGRLVVVTKHHGHDHVNMLDADKLLTLLGGKGRVPAA